MHLETTYWTAAEVEAIRRQRVSAPAVIGADDVLPVTDTIGIWDAWPVQDADGMPAAIGPGRTLWIALGAPRRDDDPDERHNQARIHLVLHANGQWRHLGPVMPDGFSPGSREWSGSAVLAADRQTLTLYFTAAGRRGEAVPTFEQRLFSAQATLIGRGDRPTFANWRGLREIVQRDPSFYMASDGGTGKIGTIKAFRDPAYFRDHRDGREFLFFAGSRADAGSDFNGVIGAIVATSGGDAAWRLLPPIIDATGVNNELERPHVIRHGGLYYLFWSSQRHVFAPALAAPTGLYGMVAPSLDGGWRPLNGTGLVFANPAEAPRQAYSWFVLPDLSVISFIDDWGRGADAAGARRFGGTFAPLLHLRLAGETAGLRS